MIMEYSIMHWMFFSRLNPKTAVYLSRALSCATSFIQRKAQNHKYTLGWNIIKVLGQWQQDCTRAVGQYLVSRLKSAARFGLAAVLGYLLIALHSDLTYSSQKH